MSKLPHRGVPLLQPGRHRSQRGPPRVAEVSGATVAPGDCDGVEPRHVGEDVDVGLQCGRGEPDGRVVDREPQVHTDVVCEG